QIHLWFWYRWGNGLRRVAAQQLVEESFHARQDRWSGLRFIAGATQRASVGDAMREPGHKLLHLARRAMLVFIDQHFEIGADHLVAISFGRLIVASGLSMLANLAEDPGIGCSRAADHHAVTACLGHHGDRVFRRANIAVADHWNLYRVFYRGNPLPAC